MVDTGGKESESASAASPTSIPTTTTPVSGSSTDTAPAASTAGGVSTDGSESTKDKGNDKGKATATAIPTKYKPDGSNSSASSSRYGADDPFMLDALEEVIIKSGKPAAAQIKNGEPSRNANQSTGQSTLSTSPDQAQGEFYPRGTARSAAEALVRLADADYYIDEAGRRLNDTPDVSTTDRTPFLLAPPELPELLAQA